ncbi:hypothetical protein TeGR_g7555 [Tetraparma gracilis]|uniref:Uncharacterized protein n=1 Tax=Tetraparma gracilis TaxID=2962635 RepID=A0ABQ6N5C4_9STRA|nr:hypothetical protein TeGR_g7555 [Tetraparma gracilis]
MPSAPPLSSLRDTYTHATGDRRPEPLGRRHDDLCAVRSPSGHPAPSSSGRWWSPQQLDKLVEGNASCPHDHYYQAAADGGPSSGPPSGSIPVAVPVAVPADSDPIFFTDEQMPVYSTPPPPSVAEASFDGFEGVSSSDPLLHMDESGEELLNFLTTWNTRPRQTIRVHGYHEEERRRYETREDDEGRTFEEVVYYMEHVTDFDYHIDISHFIFPFGYVCAADDDDEGVTVPDVIQEFLQQDHPLKELVMEKTINDFDFFALEAMIEGYLRSQGWYRGLSVSFPRANHKVRVWKRSCISNFWENPCGKVLCYLSLVGCCVVHCLKCRHRNTGVISEYRIDYHPLQVFETIKGQLWCPGLGEQILSSVLSSFW